MELKNLMVDSKSAWVDFPGLDGFSVEVVNLSRKELTNLRKDALFKNLIEKLVKLEKLSMKKSL